MRGRFIIWTKVREADMDLAKELRDLPVQPGTRPRETRADLTFIVSVEPISTTATSSSRAYRITPAGVACNGVTVSRYEEDVSSSHHKDLVLLGTTPPTAESAGEYRIQFRDRAYTFTFQ
jgi:hypothetical protein